jgi:hypothetical protein
MSSIAVRQFQRSWIPADRSLERFFGSNLFIPYGLRQRFRGAVPSDSVEVALDPAGLPAESEGRFAAVRRGAELIGSETPLRWILVGDYDHSSRGQALVLYFREAAASPFCVAKIRRPDQRLKHEHETLQLLQERGIAGLPRVLAFDRSPSDETLLLEWTGGTSIYREQYAELRPATMVDRHFGEAATWLTDFQRRLGLRGSHGDFWSRNILRRNGATCVVDWESFDAEADPFDDVFHFALSYVLDFRWSSLRATPPDVAFRKGFLEENTVSRAVRAWLVRFATFHGVRFELLRERFHRYLDEGRPPSGSARLDELLAIIRGADQCVFSG